MWPVAMVQGASRGLGLELTRQLLEAGGQVIASCRNPSSSTALRALESDAAGRLSIVALDLSDEPSIARAAATVTERFEAIDLLINAAGLLHDGELQPEKKLAQVDPERLLRVFEVNAFGPLLVAKHFASALLHGRPAVLANISARVGSIDDNRLGGWYAYRASKAAQNMFTKNLAIELGRRNRNITVVALHPGTVDTGLSKPFQRSVPPGKLFTVERAARQLLSVIERLRPEDNGRFLAYDGTPITW